MMLRALVSGLIAVSVSAGPVMAQNCPGGTSALTQTQLNTLFSNDTWACLYNGGSLENNEEHRPDHTLWDWKQGSNPNDPYSQVGQWQTYANNNVGYFYTPQQVLYGYFVCATPTQVSGLNKPGNVYGTFVFADSGAGTNYNITISNGHC